jgi:hypothetical protein
MEYWKRQLVSTGFAWTSYETHVKVVFQIVENRWTAVLVVPLASGDAETTNFFAEDVYEASLQKCLLYVWQALSVIDRSTFDLEEALADLKRFVP